MAGGWRQGTRGRATIVKIPSRPKRVKDDQGFARCLVAGARQSDEAKENPVGVRDKACH